MARAYTVATAALALGTSYKWVDNVLSHYQIPGVEQERQGVRRRLNLESLILLRITLLLSDSFGLPLAKAISVAQELKPTGRYQANTHVLLDVDLRAIELELQKDVDAVVEIAPVPRRGRPTKQTGRLV